MRKKRKEALQNKERYDKRYVKWHLTMISKYHIFYFKELDLSDHIFVDFYSKDILSLFKKKNS